MLCDRDPVARCRAVLYSAAPAETPRPWSSISRPACSTNIRTRSKSACSTPSLPSTTNMTSAASHTTLSSCPAATHGVVDGVVDGDVEGDVLAVVDCDVLCDVLCVVLCDVDAVEEGVVDCEVLGDVDGDVLCDELCVVLCDVLRDVDGVVDGVVLAVVDGVEDGHGNSWSRHTSSIASVMVSTMLSRLSKLATWTTRRVLPWAMSVSSVRSTTRPMPTATVAMPSCPARPTTVARLVLSGLDARPSVSSTTILGSPPRPLASTNAIAPSSADAVLVMPKLCDMDDVSCINAVLVVTKLVLMLM